MTLAKKHFHRLWFPEPGTGGAIPTRSEYGLSKSAFDQMMPVEFWRDVVARIAQEAPNTLLLAEAFWMMEGYFVRTLGMHRVYNSAFMHMLRDEDNSNFRDLIVKTIEFDPEILKRYVNFMNNPDEETAKSQFGSDGKYFGVCTLLSTLPGLPMFGHGQIEGYEEKYGMEYKRSYYDEQPDVGFIERHEREIFPLLRKRYLFSGSEYFHLYDFFTSQKTIDENVIVFSNRYDSESALVIYNNKWGSTKGRIKQSVVINGKTSSLFENLGLDVNKKFVIFRDHISSLEYIRPIQDIKDNGLILDIGAYRYQVLLDFSSVDDPENIYIKIHEKLNGNGTPDLAHAYKEVKLSRIYYAVQELIGNISSSEPVGPRIDIRVVGSLDSQIFLSQIAETLQGSFQLPDFKFKSYFVSVDSWLSGFAIYRSHFGKSSAISQLADYSILVWGMLRFFYDSIAEDDWEDLVMTLSSSWVHGNDEHNFDAHNVYNSITLLSSVFNDLSCLSFNLSALADFWFSNGFCRVFIRSHEHDGVTWFNQEQIEILFEISRIIILIFELTDKAISLDDINKLKLENEGLSSDFSSALKESGYQEEKFKKATIK
jgi:hypothetical protein